MLRPDLARLHDYLADALSLAAPAFLERHPWPMLVVPEPSPELFARRARPETAPQRPLAPTVEVSLAPGLMSGASLDALCLAVRPRRGGASNRVSLGRSPDADVVLLDESVSRFHAQLAWGQDRGRCLLTDLGARNGTAVDGALLPLNGKAEVRSGSLVSFGALAARFYAPRDFMDWLMAGAPLAGAAPAGR
jgi:hypothetical protein